MDGIVGMRQMWLLIMGGLHGKILRSLVGAAPVCPPVSPCKGASIVKSSCMIRDAQIYFGMETPLRGRSGGHTGTAPTIPNTYRRSAKVKIKVLALAELPQMTKQKI